MENNTRYTINFETIDGEKHEHTWAGAPLNHYREGSRPHSPQGLNFKDGETLVSIPWHQVKKTAFTQEQD